MQDLQPQDKDKTRTVEFHTNTKAVSY